MITRPLADSRARRRGRRPRALSAHFCLLSGRDSRGVFGMHGAAGLGGTAHFPPNEPLAHGSEPFNAIQVVVSGCSIRSRLVHCYGRFTLGIRLGLFPLGLLLVPSESALRTTPFLVFRSVRGGVASAF